MLFIGTKHNMRIFRVSPLSSYETTLKQQLNGYFGISIIQWTLNQPTRELISAQKPSHKHVHNNKDLTWTADF